MNTFDTAVVVQKVARGRERAFNGYRDATGRVVFTGNWIYGRGNRYQGAPLYNVDRLLDPRQPGLEKLRNIVEEVAGRLEIEGPFHIELIGDKVIDVGARLSGGGLPRVEAETTTVDPFALYVDAFQNPDLLDTFPKLYERKTYGAVVFISTKGGAKMSHRMADRLDQFQRQGRILSYHFSFAEGVELKPTIDIDGVIASMLIQGRTREERESLADELLRWRDEGLFETR